MSRQKPGAGIRCPLCNSQMGVIESRNNAKSIRRRRECLTSGCAGRVKTVEVVAPRHRKGHRANTTNLAPVPDGHDLVAVPRAVVRQLSRATRAAQHDPVRSADRVPGPEEAAIRVTGLPTPRLTATITPPTCKAGLGRVVVAGYTPPTREPDPADEGRIRRQKERVPSTCKRCGVRGHIASNEKFHPRPL